MTSMSASCGEARAPRTEVWGRGRVSSPAAPSTPRGAIFPSRASRGQALRKLQEALPVEDTERRRGQTDMDLHAGFATS